MSSVSLYEIYFLPRISSDTLPDKRLPTRFLGSVLKSIERYENLDSHLPPRVSAH